MHHYLCNEEFRVQVSANLKKFPAESHNTHGLRHAAVALTIVDAGKGAGIVGIRHLPDLPERAALILTRRAPKLNKHKGQWALPGGRIDPGETPEQAALRELEEEVGLDLGPESILGRLDDFTTRSGYVMTPIVVWGGRETNLTANPHEVASIHRIPVDEFMREDAPSSKRFPGSDEMLLLMPIGRSGIAAPTGAMLYQFREVAVAGRNTRVAHYEQPRFAWK